MEGRVSLWIPEQNMCTTDHDTHELLSLVDKGGPFTAVSKLFALPLLSLLTGRGACMNLKCVWKHSFFFFLDFWKE